MINSEFRDSMTNKLDTQQTQDFEYKKTPELRIGSAITLNKSNMSNREYENRKSKNSMSQSSYFKFSHIFNFFFDFNINEIGYSVNIPYFVT